MNDRDKTDLWTALAVGAVVGIGVGLLLRAGDELEPRSRRLLAAAKPIKKSAQRTLGRAGRDLGRGARRLGEHGEELLAEGTEVLAGLRRDAARVLAETRRELEEMADGSVKRVRRAARRARRRLA